MNTTHAANAYALPLSPRATSAASLAFAAMLTLAMLLGVDTLATTDAAAPQLAQTATAHA